MYRAQSHYNYIRLQINIRISSSLVALVVDAVVALVVIIVVVKKDWLRYNRIQSWIRSAVVVVGILLSLKFLLWIVDKKDLKSATNVRL